MAQTKEKSGLAGQQWVIFYEIDLRLEWRTTLIAKNAQHHMCLQGGLKLVLATNVSLVHYEWFRT